MNYPFILVKQVMTGSDQCSASFPVTGVEVNFMTECSLLFY